MLIDHERTFYFQILKEKELDLQSIASETRAQFQTEERTTDLLREWDGLTLLSVCRASPSKTLSDSLQSLILRLSDIQSSLPEQYRNDVIVRDKLLKSIRDVTVCRLVY